MENAEDPASSDTASSIHQSEDEERADYAMGVKTPQDGDAATRALEGGAVSFKDASSIETEDIHRGDRTADVEKNSKIRSLRRRSSLLPFSVLRFENISYVVGKGDNRKKILSDVSGLLTSGRKYRYLRIANDNAAQLGYEIVPTVSIATLHRGARGPRTFGCWEGKIEGFRSRNRKSMSLYLAG